MSDGDQDYSTEVLEMRRESVKADLEDAKKHIEYIKNVLGDVESVLNSIYADISEFENKSVANNDNEEEREKMAQKIKNRIRSVTENGPKLNRELFVKMVNYPEFYWDLTGGMMDSFNLEDEDYQNFFDKVMEYAKSLPDGLERLLWFKRLKEMSYDIV